MGIRSIFLFLNFLPNIVPSFFRWMNDFYPSFPCVSFDNALASVALEMVSSVHFAKISVAADVLIDWVLPDTRATDSN